MTHNLQISQQNINHKAIEVCRILSDAGHKAYIVGGCVRDLILGEIPKDYDITTNATPEEIISLFPLTYPTGLQHGTVTVSMGDGVENHFEVTTFRVEGKYKDGRRPEEVFFVMNVEEDLSRRDLTINAIAYDPISELLIDPFGGIEDLNKKIIRAVGKPEARFTEDGLRIMRAARFAARFDYEIDNLTLIGMQKSINTLLKVSKERVKDELCKTLVTKNPTNGLQILLQVGALEIACPFLTSEKPLLHFIQFIDKCPGELETRLALLYANCPVKNVQDELNNLKFSNSIYKKVIFLLNLFDKYDYFVRKDNSLAYREFISFIKNSNHDDPTNTLKQFIYLIEAMGLSSESIFAKYKNEVVFSRKEMQINGEDLLILGIKPGPKMKNILDKCYLEILNNPEHNTKQYLCSISLTF